MHSSTSKLFLALLLSIVVHSLLFLQGNPSEPLLSKHPIIHARLDKQDRELIQQEQLGQMTQQHNKQITQASNPSQTTQDLPLQPEVMQTQAKAQQQNREQPVISRKVIRDQKALNAPTKDGSTQTPQKINTVTTQPSIQKNSQINSNSRAQVEALKGNEDPIYTSYRQVLRQYLGQRLEAKTEYKGTARLKIKIEYGSFG